MNRKRINRMVVCSSDHYEESKRIHREYVRSIHSTFVELDIQVKLKHRYFKMCMGHLIEIPEDMAKRFISIKETVIIK